MFSRNAGPIIATVRFLGSDKGGRITEPASGFKPQIDSKGIYTSCTMTVCSTEVAFLKFDADYDVFLELMYAERFPGELVVGTAVKIFEGNKLIGTGQITGGFGCSES